MQSDNEPINITNVKYEIFPNIKFNFDRFWESDAAKSCLIIIVGSISICFFIAIGMYNDRANAEIKNNHELNLKNCNK
jgi:hypothetical protein